MSYSTKEHRFQVSENNLADGPNYHHDSQEVNIASNDEKLSQESHKLTVDCDLPKLRVSGGCVEVARPQSTYIVHPMRDLRLWTRNLHFTREYTVPWWIVGVVSLYVGEGKELSATRTFVVVPSCIPFAIETSCDEVSARLVALKTFGWLLGK